MDNLVLDLRHALRTLRRRPGFAFAAILSLAVGLGASATLFSVGNALLLKQLPGVTRTDGLVELTRAQQGTTFDLSLPLVDELGKQTRILSEAVAFARTAVSVTREGEPVVRAGLAVGGNYFRILGTPFTHGRDFARGEADFPETRPVVVLSDALARTLFGSAEQAVGQDIQINGSTLRVIGVTPPGFAGHHAGLLADLFLPLGLTLPGLPKAEGLRQWNSSEVEALGRLAPGVRPGAASEALTSAAVAFEGTWVPELDPNRFRIVADPWGPLPVTVRSSAAAFVGVLTVLVLLALTIACVNVTTLLLARAVERQREFAVRRALGADGRRLSRQLTTEVLLLFLLAGLAGVPLVIWGSTVLSHLAPPIPLPGRIGFDFLPDPGVFAASLLLTLTAGLLVSLAPALHAARLAPGADLRDGGSTTDRGRSRVRSTLVGAQVAVMSLLLIVAALVGRGLAHLRELDPGWTADGVLVTSLNLEQDGTDAARGRVFYRELLDRVTRLPGVEAAALARKLPLGGRASFGDVSVDGVVPPDGRIGFDAALNRVTAGYFRTLRIPLLRGRDIRPRDDEYAPRVAVINQAMADRLWPDGDALGRQFHLGTGPDRFGIEVIGVVGNVKYGRLDEETPNFYYVPSAQWYNSEQTLHVRPASGQEGTVAAAVREVIRTLDPALPAASLTPLPEAMDTFLLPQRLAAWVSGLMGGFGLLLAAFGLYAVTAFMVGRRTREIGVRLALGASGGDILRLMLRRGGVAPAVGLVAGLLAGLVFARLAASVLAGLDSTDPVALLGVPAVVGTIVLLAIAIPVGRVLRRNPMGALREE
jgi:putative ABC transport system permease protein